MATTEKETAVPATVVWLTGWTTIEGATAAASVTFAVALVTVPTALDTTTV